MTNRLSAKAVLAVLEERIDHLTKRFDKYERMQEDLFSKLIENERSINDLSHVVREHGDFISLWRQTERAKFELSNKWKLAFGGAIFSAVASLFVQLIIFYLKGI